MKWFAVIITMFCYACGSKPPANKAASESTSGDSVYGKVVVFDSSALNIVDTSAFVQRIGSGFEWSEGPVWVPQMQALLFSDVLKNTIYKWSEQDSIQLFLTPSGYTEAAERDGENGSNGLTVDWDGRLLLCQSGNRHVVRLNSSYNNPMANFAVLSSGYDGRKFNSPNDLVSDSQHSIFFTDPVYGLPKQADDPTREIRFEGVYKIDSTGRTTLLIDSIPRPNGIALSPDESILYIASSDAGKPRWYAYRLNQGHEIKSGGIFIDAAAMKKAALVDQGPDGMKVDSRGNLFCSGPDGINVFSPSGKRLALIQVFGRRTSNCAFNENKNTLFITADDNVFRVQLKG